MRNDNSLQERLEISRNVIYNTKKEFQTLPLQYDSESLGCTLILLEVLKRGTETTCILVAVKSANKTVIRRKSEVIKLNMQKTTVVQAVKDKKMTKSVSRAIVLFFSAKGFLQMSRI